jgi:hypothetical protein
VVSLETDEAKGVERLFTVLVAAMMAAGFAWNLWRAVATGVAWSRFHGQVERDSDPGLFRINLLIKGVCACACAAAAVFFSLVRVAN